MGQPQSGYEQAAIYWRERAEAAEAELAFLKESTGGNTQMIASHLGISMQPASILSILIRNAPRAVSKTYLMEHMSHTWETSGRQKTADVQICRLRKLLAARGLAGAIKTLWGFGYSIDASAAEQIMNEALIGDGAGKDSVTFRSPSALMGQSTDKVRAVG